MGYRYNIPVDVNQEPPSAEDMLPRFEIRNGAILRIAFKCYYAIHEHDHPLYVYPHIAGDVALCRDQNHHPYYSLSKVKSPMKYEPIDLLSRDEDYSPNASVLIEEDDGFITIDSAYIDSSESNMIRISMNVQYPEFHDEPIEKRFTVFVNSYDMTRIDAVCHGIIVVLPGTPFVTNSEEPETPVE